MIKCVYCFQYIQDPRPEQGQICDTCRELPEEKRIRCGVVYEIRKRISRILPESPIGCVSSVLDFSNVIAVNHVKTVDVMNAVDIVCMPNIMHSEGFFTLYGHIYKNITSIIHEAGFIVSYAMHHDCEILIVYERPPQ